MKITERGGKLGLAIVFLACGSICAQDSKGLSQIAPTDAFAPSSEESTTDRSIYSPIENVGYTMNGPTECGTTCSTTSGCDTVPFWHHRHRGFADYLYLSATDVDVNYALPVDALGDLGTPTGAASFVSPDYKSGFRVGGGWALNECSSITATFWNFQSKERDRRALDPAPLGTTEFLSPLLLDPATFNVASESARAEAFYDIDFRMVDLAYERLISGGASHAVNLILGARYGQLDQELRTNYSILGGTSVESNIDFHGVGPRIGLNGEWLVDHGFFVYGQGAANFLAGEFKANYEQQNTFAGQQSVVSFEDDRIVSLLELEMGLGWQTPGGRLRVSSGYYISSWFNAMTMPEVIGAVHSRQLNDVSDNLTFNGLTSRVELRF